MFKNIRISNTFIVDRSICQQVLNEFKKEFPDTLQEVKDFNHSSGQPLVGDPGDYVQINFYYNPTIEFHDDLSWELNKKSFMELMETDISIMDAIHAIHGKHTTHSSSLMDVIRAIDGKHSSLSSVRTETAQTKAEKFCDEYVSKFEMLFEKLKSDLGFPLRKRAHWPKNGIWQGVCREYCAS